MYTSRIIVVSRTRMGGNSVCVGAYDVDRRESIRLLDANGYNQSVRFPLQIFDVITARYIYKENIEYPHTEDVMLQSYNPYPNVQEVCDAFKANASLIKGKLTNCFNGKLFQPGRGAMAIPNNDVPDHSVCFWQADNHLELNQYGSYVYRIGNVSIQIKYVGFPEAVQRIEAGRIVRLSLSRRWSSDDQEKLCWLQLSGWY